MRRALVAVGALLAAAFLGFGLVVFLTRSEDRVAVDDLLAERLARAIQLAEEESDGRVDLRELADFPWDRVIVAAPGTYRNLVSARLGSPYTGDVPFGSFGQVFVFARGKKLARTSTTRTGDDHRVRAPGRRPAAPGAAVLQVRDLVASPAS